MPAGLRHGLELKPRLARNSHFRPQSDQSARLDHFHTPKIQRVANTQVNRVTTATAHADTATKPVHHPAQLPRPIHIQPASRAAQSRKTPIDRVGRGGHRSLTPLDDHALAADERHRRLVTLAGSQRITPCGLNGARAHFFQRQPNGGRVVERLNRREKLECRRIAHNDFVAQTFDQRLGDAGGNGRDEMHPVRRQPRRQHRHGEQPSCESPRPRVTRHHLGVSQHILPADFEDAPSARGAIQRGHEIVQHIANGNWLNAREHPLRTNHHRQAFRQVTNHFKRQTARTDDHRRAKFRHWHARRAQRRARFVT